MLEGVDAELFNLVKQYNPTVTESDVMSLRPQDKAYIWWRLTGESMKSTAKKFGLSYNSFWNFVEKIRSGKEEDPLTQVGISPSAIPMGEKPRPTDSRMARLCSP